MMHYEDFVYEQLLNVFMNNRDYDLSIIVATVISDHNRFVYGEIERLLHDFGIVVKNKNRSSYRFDAEHNLSIRIITVNANEWELRGYRFDIMIYPPARDLNSRQEDFLKQIIQYHQTKKELQIIR